MMLGRDLSMPNIDPKADLSSEDRELARAFALDLLTGKVDMALIPPRLISAIARAVIRYVPEPVPEPAPHEIASADDKTRPAVVGSNHTDCGCPHGAACAPYSGSPAVDFPPAPAMGNALLPPPGVICEPIEEESSGVCELSDDSSTSQNRLNFTAAYDLDVHGDITKR